MEERIKKTIVSENGKILSDLERTFIVQGNIYNGCWGGLIGDNINGKEHWEINAYVKDGIRCMAFSQEEMLRALGYTVDDLIWFVEKWSHNVL